MNLSKSNLRKFLSEIKYFFGEDWFEEECVKSGKIPDPAKTHPIVYSWIQTNKHLNGDYLPGLNTTPTQQMLTIENLGTYLQLIVKSNVIDSKGNIIGLSSKELFQNRLRSPSQFYSAFYEIQIASLYIRAGNEVLFIHDDTKQTPEFLVKAGNQEVYIECKRIQKRPLDNETKDLIRKLTRKVIGILGDFKKTLGILLICDTAISNRDGWIEKEIKDLIASGKTPLEFKSPGYSLKLFELPLPAKLEIKNGHVFDFQRLYYETILYPIIEQYLDGATISTVGEEWLPNCTVLSLSHQVWKTERYFATSFKELPNIIVGIKKSIKKASAQLPKTGNGIVYVEMPPYKATDKEILEFHRIIGKELSANKRINALILTSRISEVKSFEYISNVIVNEKSKYSLPKRFEVLPLSDRFMVN